MLKVNEILFVQQYTFDDLVSESTKTNYERVINRSLAIKKALDMAEDNDIILIAGKGDDKYMAIKAKNFSMC